MKKTVSINIAGIFFHIDENAFQALEQYLESLRAHFSTSEGKDEIMEDIEARIAEVFQTKIDDKKQVIQQEDVEEIIALLGKPADISGNENANGAEVPPAEPKDRRKTRRLYRDTDNRVLGGVCSGLAHYFNVDPIWFRIAFLIMLFIFGSSVLVYVALWILIPPATNTTEKLEMKGEHINIQNIEKNIKIEIADLKKRYRSIRAKHQPETEEGIRDFKRRMRHLKKELRNKRRIAVVENGSLGSRIGGVIENLVFYTVKVILMVIGIFFLILGTALTIGLLLSITGSENFFMVTKWGMSTFSLPAFSSLIFESPNHSWIFLIGLLLLIGIPLLMMIFNGVKLIFGIRKRIRVISILATTLWLSGLLLTIWACVIVYSAYSEKATDKKILSIQAPADSLIYLDVSKSNINLDEYDEMKSKLVFNNVYFISDTDSTRSFGLPVVRFIPTDSGDYTIVINRYAHGSTIPQARRRADDIRYLLQQNDSMVIFSNFFRLPEHEKWRNQKVKITLKVPVGQKLHFNESMENLLYDHDVENGTWNEDMIGKTMIMTPTGLGYGK